MTNEPIDNMDIALERIRTALASNRINDAMEIALDLHRADLAEIFNELSDAEQDALLPLLDMATQADLFEELEDKDVLEAVETLSTAQLADLLDEMEPDEAADLLGDLPPDQVSQLLAQMEDVDEVLPLLGYPDETAGGLMTTSYIALRRHTTTEQAIQFLREVSPDTEIPYFLYVVDREKHLIGVIGLRELVVAKPDAVMESILDPDVVSVTVGTDQEEVARIMTRYDLAAMPVVDEHARLVGVITHDDILDVLEDEATEDIYRLGNVTDSFLEPESPVFEQIKGRLPWLFLNTITALFASWVITNFEGLIGQVAILAAFQSVIAGMGGNSGTQTVVMIVRALALDKMEPKRLLHVIGKQMLVGLMQGLSVGLVVGTSVALWRGNFYLGVVITLAMVANMVIAGLISTIVPVGLTAIGKDPALASSVLVTAATDSFGFFVFLSLAAYFINNLQ
jgi:magnesium transporter